MEIKSRKLKGVFEIILNPLVDNRGFFMRTFDFKMFKEAGLDRDWVQENHAKTKKKGVIRGLHFQLPPHTETKMVRCVRGAVLDVFVDIRKGSSTFGQWDAIELSEENKKMVFIPRGFAHGYCTLTENSEILYKVDNFYSPQAEAGLLWNDEKIGIPWPIETPILSEKDGKNLSFDAFKLKYATIDI